MTSPRRVPAKDVREIGRRGMVGGGRVRANAVVRFSFESCYMVLRIVGVVEWSEKEFFWRWGSGFGSIRRIER